MKHLLTLILLLGAGALVAQNTKQAIVLKNRYGHKIYRIKENQGIRVRDKCRHVYKGRLSILNKDSIAVGRDTLVLDSIRKISKHSDARIVTATGMAMIGLPLMVTGAGIVYTTKDDNTLEGLVGSAIGATFAVGGLVIVTAAELISGIVPKRITRHRTLTVRYYR